MGIFNFGLTADSTDYQLYGIIIMYINSFGREQLKSHYAPKITKEVTHEEVISYFSDSCNAVLYNACFGTAYGCRNNGFGQ